MTFGERLKDLRNKNNWSQQQLSNNISLSYDTIKSLETNRSMPSIETLNKLCDLFGCTSDYLLGRNLPNEALKEDIKLSPYSIVIKNAIEKSDLTMDEVAKRITSSGHKIHASYLGKLISGKREPASDDINKVLAEFFKLDQIELRTFAWLEKIPSDVLENIKEDKPNETKNWQKANK